MSKWLAVITGVAAFVLTFFTDHKTGDRHDRRNTIRRKQPGKFPTSTVELLQTFAAQSVLAIQNARLFREIEDKSRQLQLASENKSQFVSGMSHELRTPSMPSSD